MGKIGSRRRSGDGMAPARTAASPPYTTSVHAATSPFLLSRKTLFSLEPFVLSRCRCMCLTSGRMVLHLATLSKFVFFMFFFYVSLPFVAIYIPVQIGGEARNRELPMRRLYSSAHTPFCALRERSVYEIWNDYSPAKHLRGPIAAIYGQSSTNRGAHIVFGPKEPL